MKNGLIIQSRPVAVPFGKLQQVQSLGAKFRQAHELPLSLPVLTCHISQDQKYLLDSQYDRSCLGFGNIQLGDGCHLQTIRFQLGGLQFYWVAEMVDPEVWAAIDRWRKVGRLPLLFKVENGDSWDETFTVVKAPRGPLQNEAFRRTVVPAPTASTATALFSLISSGVLQSQATTDIPGIPLRHVFVNALLTKRIRQFVDETAIVSPGGKQYA